MNFHIEGMGVVGSILAWNLHKSKIQFTWEDAELPGTAWEASVGCVHPTTDPIAKKAYIQWFRWHDHGAPWTGHLNGVTEVASYWYTNNPYTGKMKPLETISPVHLSPQRTLHVNVQKLVRETRTFFSGRRIPWKETMRPEAVHVRANITQNYKWGWSARAEVHFSRKLTKRSKPFRVSVDLDDLFAYPIPGDERHHYIGAAPPIFHQKTPTPMCNPQDQLEYWAEEANERSDGFVALLGPAWGFRQGWTPYPCYGAANGIKRGDLRPLPADLSPFKGQGVHMAPLIASNLTRGLK